MGYRDRPHKPSPFASSGHVDLTAPSSTNTKSAWTQLIAASTIPAKALIVTVSNGSWGSRCLFDIGTGAASSEVVLVGDLIQSMDSNAATASTYLIPIAVPAGTRIAARVACTRTDATTFKAAVTLIPSTFNPPGGAAYTWGEDTSDSGGTSAVAGTGGAKGAYVELVAATDAPIEWLIVGAAQTTAAASTFGSLNIDIATGAGGSEVILIPDLPLQLSARSSGPVGPIPVNIPAGTRLAARISSNTNSHAVDLVLYGFA